MTARDRTRTAVALNAAAIAVAAVAVAAAVADVLLVLALVGDTLVPLWTVSVGAALLALLLAVGAAIARGRRPDKGPRRLVMIVVVGLAVLAAVLASVTGRSAIGSSYTLLADAGSSGCRIATVETSFLLNGRAEAYAFPGSAVALALPRASLEIDGGGKPFARELATLAWVAPSSAQISAPGMTTDNVIVDCA